MSLRVMTVVWDESPRKGGELIVLLALADWANEDGVCWPSVAKLAERARMSERSVQKVLTRLKDAGEVEIHYGGFISGRNRTNTYRVLTGRTFDTPSRAAPPATTEGTPPVKAGGTTVEPPVEPPSEPSTTSAAGTAAFPGLEPPEPPEDSDEAKVREIWTHYFEVFGDRLRVKELTERRGTDIRKALKAVGGDASICCRAIDGLQSFRKKNPTGSQDVSLSVPFATGPHSKSNLTDQIEWWAQQADARTIGAGLKVPLDLSGVPSVSAGTIRVRRDWARRKFEEPDNEYVQQQGEAALTWLREHCGHAPVFIDGKITGWQAVEA